MPIRDYYNYIHYYEFPIVKTNLRTGVGHGHYRDFNRERPAKYRVRKLRSRAKMRKASKRRNRR